VHELANEELRVLGCMSLLTKNLGFRGYMEFIEVGGGGWV
jgi:hypothetical protein